MDPPALLERSASYTEAQRLRRPTPIVVLEPEAETPFVLDMPVGQAEIVGGQRAHMGPRLGAHCLDAVGPVVQDLAAKAHTIPSDAESDAPVTVRVRRRIRPGFEAAYEKHIEILLKEAESTHGYLNSAIVRPEPGADDYTWIIYIR
jgi:hypothetical protein